VTVEYRGLLLAVATQQQRVWSAVCLPLIAAQLPFWDHHRSQSFSDAVKVVQSGYGAG